MYIKIHSHSGGCCGVRVISQLGTNPKSSICSKKNRLGDDTAESKTWYNDLHGENKKDLFFPARPVESALRRFDAAVAYIISKRPKGLIEVVIRDGYTAGYTNCMDWNSQKAWIPLLRRRGFRKVSSFANSNTKAMLHVFHKIVN